jgi:hypothetical protein
MLLIAARFITSRVGPSLQRIETPQRVTKTDQLDGEGVFPLAGKRLLGWGAAQYFGDLGPVPVIRR